MARYCFKVSLQISGIEFNILRQIPQAYDKLIFEKGAKREVEEENILQQVGMGNLVYYM